VLAACAACAATRPPPPPLPPLPTGIRAIDHYGTTRFTSEELRRALGEPFEKYLVAQDNDAENARLEQAIQARVTELGFVWGKVSGITYFRPAGEETYVTIDVVEPHDRARRMPFGAAPGEELADVDGLVAAWGEYQSKGFELIRAKSLSPQRVPCKAFHCLFGFDHPDLAKFGPIFDERVPAHRAELLRLLHAARDPKLRAGAAFLVAHLRDGREVVAELLPALRDPAGLVRNNAMRVLQDIAHHHPEIPVPIEPALDALDFPETTDRNKALAMVDGLADRPEYHAAILARGGLLLALLKLQQPNNHDFAYSILKKATGQSFGERDYAAWERWLAARR